MSDHRRCERCGGQYMRSLPSKKDQEPDRGICPTPLCWALETWTADEWEGAARMAEVRKACAIALSAIDVEAMRRVRGQVHVDKALAEIAAAERQRVGEAMRATRTKTRRK